MLGTMARQGLPGAPVERGVQPPSDMTADDRSSLNDWDVIGLRDVKRTASESGASQEDTYDV